MLFVEIEPDFSAVDLSLKVSDRFGESIGVGFSDGFLLDFRISRPHAQERESQHWNNQDDTANSQKSLRHDRDYSPLRACRAEIGARPVVHHFWDRDKETDSEFLMRVSVTLTKF